MADYDIPTPDEIADTIASEFEERLKTAPDGTARVIDARSPRSVLAVIGRVTALALYEVYQFLAWIIAQFFPDTCVEAILPLHARMWGIPRVDAASASGSVVFLGAEGTAIAAGARLTLSGAVWATTAGLVVGAGGSASVTVEAVAAGAAGNSAAGATLALEVPVVGLSRQSAEVEAGGLTGGLDIEPIESWRGRICDHIREPPHGGANHDYVRWVREALPGVGRVRVHNAWVGAGTVGVVIAMPDDTTVWRAPTPTEIALAEDHLAAVAPVTATVVVVAAVPVEVPVTAAVSPWTTSVEAAVLAAALAWFRLAENAPAGVLHLSKLRERLSRAAGEDWHELTAPAGNRITLGPTEIAVPGALTVTEAA